jgi:hypothetical protein
MKDFIDRYRSAGGPQLADRAFDEYFVDGAQPSKLPVPVHPRPPEPRPLVAGRHMDMMDEEVALIDAQKGTFKDASAATSRR